MKSCFGYIRVSTQKQGEGVSLEAQKDAITAFADRNNITITEWFEEKETAAKSGRPIFSRMLKLLERGKADGLVIHKIDRSARNLKDWAVIGDLSDRGIDVYFATESLDFRSRGGRLTADIQAVIAADYIRNLRDETLKGMRGRLKQGLYPWGAPLGYLNNGGGKPKTICPIRGPLVRKAFELYASGNYSLRALEAKLATIGLRNRSGRPLCLHAVEAMLRNPFYCGIIYVRQTGETYHGQHGALIDIRTFRKVEDIRTGRAGKKVTRHNHRYRGLFRCGLCQGPLSPELQKGRVYYRCQSKGCPTTTIREDLIDSVIADGLAKIQLPEEAAVSLERNWTAWLNSREIEEELRSLDLRIAQTGTRLDRLTDLLIDGTIGQEDFNRRKRGLTLEIAELTEMRTKAGKNHLSDQEMQLFLELMKNLAGLHASLKPDEKRRLVESCFSNRQLIGKELSLEPSNWLSELKSDLAVPCGDPHRHTSRILFTNPMVREHVQKLLALFEHQIGSRSNTRSAIPQWRYNLKHQKPIGSNLPDAT